jgi:uncharacterized SAM-binding protein YcdF (DUF218 family)
MLAPNSNLTFIPPTWRTVRFRHTRGLVIVVLVMVCLGWLAWIERAPLLRGAANLWIVSDPITPTDVAVVLGGGLEVRPFAAADLYRRGFVIKILVSQVAEERVVKIGAARGHPETNRQILLKLGVPADAIETFGASNSNTKEEAMALRDWAGQRRVEAVIIQRSWGRGVFAGSFAMNSLGRPSSSRSRPSIR